MHIEGRENGEMLIDSIKEGPFQLKEEITIPATKGFPEIKCKQTQEDLTPEEKLRKSCDIKATNIIILGLPLEWSRFVTAAKKSKDLHNFKFDQFYAFLKHSENDANEVREMQQRYPDLLALLANTY
ncbi:hypothetical protein Tco_1508214, partial [Tanacetum coccineum]